MKINERTLISYSSLKTCVDKEGWLFKRGDGNKSFQKRYFVLKGNLLFYFDKERDGAFGEPLGLIILEGYTIELSEEEQEKFAFKIAFQGRGKRSYVLGSQHHTVMEEWMKALAVASYDYMKLMVLELQLRLSELEEAERLSTSKGIHKARVNPFNKGNEQGVEYKGGGEYSRSKNPSWHVLHNLFGKRISEDRFAWIQNGGCDPIDGDPIDSVFISSEKHQNDFSLL